MLMSSLQDFDAIFGKCILGAFFSLRHPYNAKAALPPLA
jgi:hypothetical protein